MCDLYIHSNQAEENGVWRDCKTVLVVKLYLYCVYITVETVLNTLHTHNSTYFELKLK